MALNKQGFSKYQTDAEAVLSIAEQLQPKKLGEVLEWRIEAFIWKNYLTTAKARQDVAFAEQQQ